MSGLRLISRRRRTRPARRYQPADDLWVVACFFNPQGYASKLRNLRGFLEPLIAGGVSWRIVECAFGAHPFALPASENVLQVRARDVLWQKERLINLVVESLPDSCSKVAWVDCDVLFANPNWLRQASDLLEDCQVVQPFELAVRLPRGTSVDDGSGDRWRGCAAVGSEDPLAVFRGRFNWHGHTGFAWAAQRELISRHGLYDLCVAGGGDHLIGHALYGDWSSACALRVTGGSSRLHRHAAAWARSFYLGVLGQVEYVPGTLLHLWHGEKENRRYYLRAYELSGLDFDPELDLQIGANGCWEWARPRWELQQWCRDYFAARQEDGRDGAHDEPLRGGAAGNSAALWASGRVASNESIGD